MANYLRNCHQAEVGQLVSIAIPEVVTEDGVTFYVVRVEVADDDAFAPVAWTVKKRYSDFAELHATLTSDPAGAAIDAASLPEKKYIGNRDPAFIMKRRKELEAYLTSVFRFLQLALPSSMAEFLDFDKYDINFVLKNLAGKYHDVVEAGGVGAAAPDAAPETRWSPLEMFAIRYVQL